MKQINKQIKIGTLIGLKGVENLVKVIEIFGGVKERNWVKVEGYRGSFQAGHIINFTNKGQ